MLPKFNFNLKLPKGVIPGPVDVLPPGTTIAPEPPEQLQEPPPDRVEPGLTHWMRPPQGQQMEDGTMPGEEGYVDPHAGAMEEWLDIDKGPTGGFRPDGTAILHSDSEGLLAGEGDERRSGGYGKKRVGEQSRKQMNLTGQRGNSILTER